MSAQPTEVKNLLRTLVGMIVTLREQATDARAVLHKQGTTREAMRQIADWCDAQAGDWRVLCVSTPTTILSDLDGTRAGEHRSPESDALGLIGRRDLLDRSLT